MHCIDSSLLLMNVALGADVRWVLRATPRKIFLLAAFLVNIFFRPVQWLVALNAVMVPENSLWTYYPCPHFFHGKVRHVCFRFLARVVSLGSLAWLGDLHVNLYTILVLDRLFLIRVCFRVKVM